MTEVEHRVAVLNSLSQAQDRETAANILRENGIRWYLALDANRPRWDTDLRHASFRGDGIVLYDNGPSPNTARLRMAC